MPAYQADEALIGFSICKRSLQAQAIDFGSHISSLVFNHISIRPAFAFMTGITISFPNAVMRAALPKIP
jgi:hypothetical protein